MPIRLNREEDHQIIKLVNRCREGDIWAQRELYKRYNHSIFNTAYRILNNDMEAEDITQDTFLKAFEKIGTYKGLAPFGAWLKKIAINKSISRLKSSKKLVALESDPEEIAVDPPDPEPEYNVSNILRGIEELAQGHKLVLSLYLFEGYDHNEIADILNISSSTSRSQFARARKQLLNNIKKQSDEK